MAAKPRVARNKLPEALLNPTEKGPISAGIGSLLERLESEARPSKIRVPLFDGKRRSVHELTFRYPDSTGEASACERHALDFLKRMREGISKGSLPGALKEAFAVGNGEADDEDILVAFSLHFWSHADDKIDQAQAVKLVRLRPMVARETLARVDAAHLDGFQIFCFSGVVEAKKDSKAIDSSRSGSTPQEPTSTSTQIS